MTFSSPQPKLAHAHDAAACKWVDAGLLLGCCTGLDTRALIRGDYKLRAGERLLMRHIVKATHVGFENGQLRWAQGDGQQSCPDWLALIGIWVVRKRPTGPWTD